MVAIRAADVHDVPRLQAIEVDAGELFRSVGLDAIAEHPPPSAEELGAHVTDGTGWVAAVDGAVVGYAVASVVDGEGHLDQVSVARSAAGRGVGRRLIERVCRWAGEEGYDAVTLTTFVDVPWNGPYYERLGFRVVDERDQGPELAAIRRREVDAGLDVAPRAAMRRELIAVSGRPPGSARRPE